MSSPFMVDSFYSFRSYIFLFLTMKYFMFLIIIFPSLDLKNGVKKHKVQLNPTNAQFEVYFIRIKMVYKKTKKHFLYTVPPMFKNEKESDIS